MVFENCKAIIDDQNWDCSRGKQLQSGTLIETTQMNDGVLQFRAVLVRINPDGSSSAIETGNSCAK
jgi:hypothetical protein